VAGDAVLIENGAGRRSVLRGGQSGGDN